MSADPDPAVPPQPLSTPPSREKMAVPTAKRRFRQGADLDDVEESRLADEIESLNARLRDLTTRREAIKPPVPEGRGAKYYRLARRQAAPTGSRDPAADSPSAAPGATAGTAPPITLPKPPATYHAPWRDSPWHPGWLLASLGILALAVVAFFLGRTSNRPIVAKETAPPVAPTWHANDLGQLDKIFATDRTGAIGEAYKAAVQLGQVLGPRPGLSLYTSTLQARAGEVNNAEADLVRGVSVYAPPLVTAAVQDRLGFIYSRRRDFNAARDGFAAVVAANPFDAMAYYHWGETLRRSGQLVDAISKFQAALLRLPPEGPETDGLRECVAFRVRLSQIELGNDADVKTGLDTQLRQPAPNAYWLLTAVAYNLQHNDPASAEAALQRAKVLAPPALFDLLFNDYYLRFLARDIPSVAALAPELTPGRRARLDASGAYFIDP